jgi:hypothetical protein
MLQETVRRKTCHPTWTHYPDSESTSLCSDSLMLPSQRRSNKYQFFVFGLTSSTKSDIIIISLGYKLCSCYGTKLEIPHLALSNH